MSLAAGECEVGATGRVCPEERILTLKAREQSQGGNERTLVG